jgi:hypothetical protein
MIQPARSLIVKKVDDGLRPSSGNEFARDGLQPDPTSRRPFKKISPRIKKSMDVPRTLFEGFV